MQLQQYLPFTVLKRANTPASRIKKSLKVATVLTVYGIETLTETQVALAARQSCNSTYRLRY